MIAVDYGWSCLDCEQAGTGTTSDRDAVAHGKKSGHSTRSWSTPAGS